jgi:predicted dehydrogenase
MSKKIAIIGFGLRATCYARECQESINNKIEIIAVADHDMVGAKNRLLNVGLDKTKVYNTVEKLITKEKNLDGFIITSPDHCHLQSFSAIEHLNKPILLEKPLEGNAINFSALEKKLKKYKAPVLVGHCMRHAPILKKAKYLIDNGEIGEVKSMRFVQNCHYGDVFYRDWHRLRKNISSLFVEKATHDFDIMHMLNNDNYAKTVFAFSAMNKFGGNKPNDLRCSNCPEEVNCPDSLLNLHANIHGLKMTVEQSQCNKDQCVFAKEIDVNDDEMCMIEFANGVHGSYIQTFYTPANYRSRIFTIVGTLGVMEIDMGCYKGEILISPRYGTKGDQYLYKFDYLERNHYNGDTFLIRNFLGILNGTEKPFTNVDAAIMAEKLGLAAAKSAETRILEKV